jgi:hypothetical protein
MDVLKDKKKAPSERIMEGAFSYLGYLYCFWRFILTLGAFVTMGYF